MDARERILNAATEVFVEKGLSGARMQEIADRAEINKAMLHYYFRSKDLLYEEVVATTIKGFVGEMRTALEAECASETEHLRRVIGAYFDALSARSQMPRLFMQDLLNGGRRIPVIFQKALSEEGFFPAFPLLDILRTGAESGELRAVDPKQAIISLIGMIVFYFVAQPVLSRVLQLDDEDRKRFLKEREDAVIDLFLHGVVARTGSGRKD